ncbi:hypothetical protein BX666DRAFT_451923 [Dichotomocladium elegans]|nr:hypothetical protein BX666DRAFT_451923 [Dichotomocladium elegans]
MDAKFDVFIAGAGPVGLYFAYQMIQFGHSVYICDKGKGPTTQSRAILMTSRTIETLANRGIAHHFLSKSIMTPGVQVFSAGRKVGTINAVGDTPFPHWTCLPQNRTEEIFESILPKGIIHRETQVIEYKQHADHVCVAVRHRNGETTTVCARYLIAADGAHSTIRKSTPGWTFDGYSVATRFAMADAVLDGKDAGLFMNERVNSISHPKGNVKQYVAKLRCHPL